jgi:DNA-directed RNA polymerase subunit RPC12/RpoP
MAYGKRSFWVGPWHYCSRCDEKTHIGEMNWQRGILLCPTCTDRMLLGQREQIIKEVLGDGAVEYRPDPKLSDPDLITSTEDDIML